MKNATRTARVWSIVRQLAVALGMLVGIVVLMLWLMGVFHPKIGEQPRERVAGRPIGNVELATVRTMTVPVHETAVGTVRPVHEAAVASKLLAKVVEVNVKAGQSVARDEVVVRLDDSDLKARLKQAEAAVAAAQANRDQAKIEFDRVSRLYKQNAAPKNELDRAESAFKAAKAELERAEQARREAETVLEYATIRAPIDGLVVDKQVEAGDTVTPGQVLLKLYDPTRMQLVASVRESLTHRLEVGQEIPVKIEALSHACPGQVSEIVPEAESTSRSFEVKVTGPCPPGVYAGMFGRLMIPLDDQQVLVIPSEAVRRIGQLNVVQVAGDDRLQRRAVQLGRTFGDDVEVLAGLSAGEQVAVEPVDNAQEASST